MSNQNLTAEQIAYMIRAKLVGFGGRQGFLSDPGGWLGDMLLEYGEPDADDHEAARQAIEMIRAEERPDPQSAEQMVEELRVEWGVVGAYVPAHATGAVHVPVPDGSLFLDFESGHYIGRRSDTDDEQPIVWSDPEARSISGALGKLADLADKAHP